MKHPRTVQRMISRGRSPAWGAWIETTLHISADHIAKVAPLRGGRGLKQALQYPTCCGLTSLPCVGGVD